MPHQTNRRTFLKGSLAACAVGALAACTGVAVNDATKPPAIINPPAPKDGLPMGAIKGLRVSRMLLGGNLLTHFCHSRDLQYVYNLTAHYNTEAKILETLAIAEANGINTVSMHNPPVPMSILRKYRKQGGKIQWIICPTADIAPGMEAYSREVKELINDGCDAIYLWGVRADELIAPDKIEYMAKAVEIAKNHGVPSGVGCHDLRVVIECEKNKIPCDFYIKTFHHHNYPSAKLNHDSMWCSNPEETAQVMKSVEKPWIAFKTMAAGAIPPPDAFRYSFDNGADHILVGMFDYEIAEDVQIAKDVLANCNRTRPWRS